MAGERVRATSRNDLDITVSYPELDLLPGQLGGRRLLLDGELVTLDTDGSTSFSLLQQRMHTKNPAAALVSRIPVLFYAFDLLWLDNAPTLSWPYTQRREALEALSRNGTGPFSTPPSFPGPGQALLDAAAEHRLEGVVAKRLDAAYIAGRRSPAWIKVPLNRTQEGIIIGWRSGEGNRTRHPRAPCSWRPTTPTAGSPSSARSGPGSPERCSPICTASSRPSKSETPR